MVLLEVTDDLGPGARSHVIVDHDELEPRDVTILGMHFLEDMPYQQIAKTLSITPSRVCQLLWRAVERLRGQLGDFGDYVARNAA